MYSRMFTSLSLAAIVGATMLMLPIAPTSALPVSSPSLGQPFANSLIEKVYYYHRYYHHYYHHYYHRHW